MASPQTLIPRIDKIPAICITVDDGMHALFRRQAKEKNVQAVRFVGHDGVDKIGWMDTRLNKKEIGCAYAHLQAFLIIWDWTKQLDAEHVIVYEDDVLMCEDFTERFNALREYIPEDADLVYLGFMAGKSWATQPVVEMVNPHCARVQNCMSTEAILYPRATLDKLMRFFGELSVFNMAIDNYYAYEIQKNFNCYAFIPSLTCQRGLSSDANIAEWYPYFEFLPQNYGENLKI